MTERRIHRTRPEVSTRSQLSLQVSIDRHGHTVPIPMGTYVRCTYAEAPVRMYAALNSDDLGDDETLAMNEAGIGLTCDHAWYVSAFELHRAGIRTLPWRMGTPILWHVDGTFEFMWYRVMFKKGYFWARYDWLDEVTDEDFCRHDGATEPP